ncbi:MAG TPA: DUF6600 domain-containing protein [Bacteroidia bacterium]|nr:DUF6600 domain-containing protein [Bacteroidia bacterium]
MKTQLKKIALAAIVSLALVLPKGSFAQDEQDPYYQAQYGNNYDSGSNQSQNQSQDSIAPPQQPVTTQTFYDGLSPYGQWVNYGSYGYVWIPNAGPNFVPYSTSGHWIYTTYGWTWASDYNWGWAPFHYGRWIFDAAYGWMWVPGTEWAPAWVAWRDCSGYYGWAPLGPGIDISVGYGGDYGIPLSYWVFVNAAYITSPWVYRYYEPRVRCEDLYRHSVVIGRTDYDEHHRYAYAKGPDSHQVEGYVHSPVRVVPIKPTAGPGQRYDVSHLHTYRPNVAAPAHDNNHVAPAPNRSVQMNQVPQRTNYTRQYTQPATYGSRPQQNVNRGGAGTQMQQQHAVPQRTGGSRPMPAPVNRGGGGGRHR